MKRSALCLVLLLISCKTFSHEAPGVRFPANPPRVLFNDCDRTKIPEALEAVNAVVKAAEAEKLLGVWPPLKTMTLCVVTTQVGVTCLGASQRLAGCATDYGLVAVSVQWGKGGGFPLVKDRNWQLDLVHELIGSGSLLGWLRVPAPERSEIPPYYFDESTWTARDDYRRLYSAAVARLQGGAP